MNVRDLLLDLSMGTSKDNPCWCQTMGNTHSSACDAARKFVRNSANPSQVDTHQQQAAKFPTRVYLYRDECGELVSVSRDDAGRLSPDILLGVYEFKQYAVANPGLVYLDDGGVSL